MTAEHEGQYYRLIMGDGAMAFKPLFEKRWRSFLESFPTKHKNAKQLNIGNRLRPSLVCWGYALSTANVEELEFEKIIDLAIGIELLHKGSIIIDDYIDGDTARRGQAAFHVEYSPNETIMFLLFLLGKATEKLGESVSAGYVSKLICDMSCGALKELCLPQEDLFEIKELNEIVKGETTALIKNSLLFGYEINKNSDRKMGQVLESIANKCAYNFQLLNDLEPFSVTNKNVDYKNNKNFDVGKHRKNLVVAHLYQTCSPEDRLIIESNLENPGLFDLLMELIQKYDIRDYMIQMVENAKEEILQEIHTLEPLVYNKICLNDFILFITEMINRCYLRL